MKRLKKFFLSIFYALGELVSKLFTRPWLKAYSGLSINISAGFFLGVFIGPNISLPQSTKDFVVLFSYVGFGIVFLLLTVFFEREIERKEN